MNGPPIAPKTYQLDTLDALEKWLSATSITNDPDTAFYQQTRRAYQSVEGLPGVPYACLRVPTGGGKTLIAAYSIAGETRFMKPQAAQEIFCGMEKTCKERNAL